MLIIGVPPPWFLVGADQPGVTLLSPAVPAFIWRLKWKQLKYWKAVEY